MKTIALDTTVLNNEFKAVTEDACSKIAPLWPLESVVAVNPFMGYSSYSFTEASAEISATSNIKTTMPISYYLEILDEGKIKKEHIDRLLLKHNLGRTADEFLAALSEDQLTNSHIKVQSIADIASELTDQDWNRIMTERIAQWAASYFDKGQALWNASHKEYGIYRSWKEEAQIDRSLDVLGFPAIRSFIAELPSEADAAFASLVEQLQIPSDLSSSLYFQRLFRAVNGWSSFIAYLDWEEKIQQKDSYQLKEFLTILLAWEASLSSYIESSEFSMEWNRNLNALKSEKEMIRSNGEIAAEFILQEALDLSTQDQLIKQLSVSDKPQKALVPLKAQAVFCIDVRSEVFRRNLEKDPAFQTLGFAGFFGFPIEFLQIAAEKASAQCPVLLHPSYTIKENFDSSIPNEKISLKRIDRNHISKTLKSFRSGAVSCFSFVSPLGLSYLPKLLTDSLHMTRTVVDPKIKGIDKELRTSSTVKIRSEKEGDTEYGIPFQEQIHLAKNALVGMSLTKDFAPYVMFVGHGSTSVNNPHASGYDCGACGGHSGEANAKVAAKILNDPVIREGLRQEGIDIPESTTFLACLHDTTTDEVSIFEHEYTSDLNEVEISDIKRSLKMAGMLTRAERSSRLGISSNIDLKIEKRSKDWSQVRPEWGLAGCSSFIIAPRQLTEGKDLGGRSFLHSYDWTQDTDFKVLEQIMTAPMVVTSWINLQYYASTVDNDRLGAGNKTLHNVTGGLGVIEGSSGDLRVGLPWQSIHDGENYQHTAVRLSVVINAPKEAINNILKKHPSIKDLFENDWIYLLAMDDNGSISHRYAKGLSWEEIKSES